MGDWRRLITVRESCSRRCGTPAKRQLPLGINVESVAIRESEIDASVELYHRLSKHLGESS
jgi:hypothetical protein